MRIAIVSAYPPSKGTLNEYAFHLVEQFKEKEEVTEIIILSDKLPEGMEYKSDHSKITIEECWEFNNLWNIRKITKALKRQKPDVVLFNIQFLSFGDKKIPATIGLLTPLMSRLFGVPSVSLLHNIMETVDLSSAGITKNPLLKWVYSAFGTLITRFILASNLMTVTISKYVQILEKKYKAKNVALVPHGSFETPAKPNHKQVNGHFNVMSFGKFGTYKKVEPIIEAVNQIRTKFDKDIQITIAGTDSPNVKGYLDEVAKKYKETPGLHFTGYVEEEDVPKVFDESTVVVFPYTSTTGSSGVLHQAGSYGRAAILPNIGDLKSLIEEEGYAGAFFEPDDIDSLALAIEKTLSDEDYRNHLGTQNYLAASSLPMSDIADWYLIHFNSVIKKK